MAKLILRPGDRARIARRLPLSNHALERAATRHIRLRDVQYVLCFGRVWRTWCGLRFELTAERALSRPSARGVIVVVDLARRIPTLIRRGA